MGRCGRVRPKAAAREDAATRAWREHGAREAMQRDPGAGGVMFEDTQELRPDVDIDVPVLLSCRVHGAHIGTRP